MTADAAVSAGVVISGLLVLQTGWLWLDPATSLVIVAVILVGTWGLLRRSVNMALDRVPEHIPPADVVEALEGLPGVTRVHDLHIWSLSTTDVALTCHLVMPAGCPGDAFLRASATCSTTASISATRRSRSSATTRRSASRRAPRFNRRQAAPRRGP